MFDPIREQNGLKAFFCEDWFTSLGFCTILKSYFEQSWKPDDIVKTLI